MRLSTRSRYGLRAAVSIARAEGKPVTSHRLASAEHISKKYLDALLGTLRERGILHAIRGPRGGYVLSRDASEITVGQIVETFEGSLALVECVDRPDRCERSGVCLSRRVWMAGTKALREALNEQTLGDLAAMSGDGEVIDMAIPVVCSSRDSAAARADAAAQQAETAEARN